MNTSYNERAELFFVKAIIYVKGVVHEKLIFLFINEQLGCVENKARGKWELRKSSACYKAF